LAPVFYWCKNWSVTLREEHTLTAFKSRLLRKVGPGARK